MPKYKKLVWRNKPLEYYEKGKKALKAERWIWYNERSCRVVPETVFQHVERGDDIADCDKWMFIWNRDEVDEEFMNGLWDLFGPALNRLVYYDSPGSDTRVVLFLELVPGIFESSSEFLDSIDSLVGWKTDGGYNRRYAFCLSTFDFVKNIDVQAEMYLGEYDELAEDFNAIMMDEGKSLFDDVSPEKQRKAFRFMTAIGNYLENPTGDVAVFDYENFEG